MFKIHKALLDQRSIPWIILWTFAFTCSVSLAKTLHHEVNTFMVVLMRLGCALFIIIPFALKDGISALKTKVAHLHILRGIFMVMAMFCTYYAYRHLPISFATSIGFTGPLITAMLAMFFLGDRLSLPQWLLIVLGYFGVLVMVQPDRMVADPAIWIALLANFLAGVVRIFVKKLNQTDSPGQMLLFVHLTAFAIMAVGAFSYWHTPSFDQMITLFGMGVAGTFSQYSYIRALQYSDPSAVAPFEYSRLVIAMPVGMILFEEFPTIVSVIGSLIIIGSNFLMTLISVKNSKKKIPSEI